MRRWGETGERVIRERIMLHAREQDRLLMEALERGEMPTWDELQARVTKSLKATFNAALTDEQVIRAMPGSPGA
jgi:hypothetical protein